MKRICMRKIREAFRLKFEFKHSNVTIARTLGIGETTVEEYLTRARRNHVIWPLPDDMDDQQLENALYPPKERSEEGYLKPDFEQIHRELQRKGVTLRLLWEEYTDSAADSSRITYGYSAFCNLFKEWKVSDQTWMIQTHKAGENTFIDYAGHTVPVFNLTTGQQEFEAEIFVSALGASSYTFCWATRSQKQEDWIEAHKKMCQFYQGVTECWVPDNLKSGVTKADRYEPILNQTYLDLSHHYGVSIIPARVRKPQDKSRAEGAVYLVETHILAPLRDRKFFSLEELNTALQELLAKVNRNPFQKMPGASRYSQYLELELPLLKPLPEFPYELFQWGTAVVGAHYHLMVQNKAYSVPYGYVGKRVEFRYNERTVEFFHRGKAIATHALGQNAITTNPHHYPEKHRHQADISPEAIRTSASQIGKEALEWVESVLNDSSLHMRQRINSALCVVRLPKKYPPARINAACARGVHYKNFRAKGIKDILTRELDKQPLPLPSPSIILPQNHRNVRGSIYYA